MTELIIGYGALFLLSWIAAVPVVLLLGGMLDLSIPSLGGAIWRCAVLGAASVGGHILLQYVPIPIPFAGALVPAVCASIALCILFDMEFPEEAGAIAGFAVAYTIAQFLVGLVLAMALVSWGPDEQAHGPSLQGVQIVVPV